MGYPLFVKPVCAGSSFGITKVERPQQLAGAVEEAFRHDGQVLLEEAVPGFEVGCAVMGSGDLFVGEVDEIELSGGFFNYEEKVYAENLAHPLPGAHQRKRRRAYQGGGADGIPCAGLPGVRTGRPFPYPRRAKWCSTR